MENKDWLRRHVGGLLAQQEQAQAETLGTFGRTLSLTSMPCCAASWVSASSSHRLKVQVEDEPEPRVERDQLGVTKGPDQRAELAIDHQIADLIRRNLKTKN